MTAQASLCIDVMVIDNRSYSFSYDIRIDVTLPHYSSSSRLPYSLLDILRAFESSLVATLPHHVDEMTYLSVVDQHDHI